MISTLIRGVSPDKTERPVTRSPGLLGANVTNLTSPSLPPYNGGKQQNPLFSPFKPITARFVVRVHIGESTKKTLVRGNGGNGGEEEEMPDQSFLLDRQPQDSTKVLVEPLLKNQFFPASSSPERCITKGGCGEKGETGVASFTEIISKLTPEHRRIVKAMVRELAKIEGIEVPVLSSESKPEPLDHYIPAWQNSLGNEGFSPGTLGLYRWSLERLLANVPPPLTTIAIEGYIASRRESGISPTAVKTDLKAAKSFFGFLLERDIIVTDLTAKLKHPKIVKEEKVCPGSDEMAKFLAVLAVAQNPKAKLMLSLFINTGIRFDELVTLTWGKVNLEQRQITVLGKGRKWRTIPISPPIRDFLAELRNGHTDDELLFPTESKKGKWDNSDANKMIARLCRRAEIKKYSCHQFRHYFATHLQKAGVRIKVVQELLGHALASTTFDFYDHTTEEEVRKAHERFAPLLGEVLKSKEDKGGSR